MRLISAKRFSSKSSEGCRAPGMGQRILESLGASRSEALHASAGKDGVEDRFRRLRQFFSRREDTVFSKFQTGKMAAVAGGVVVVFVVLYLSTWYPEPQKEDVQGAIGQREVYREAQMTASDVTADAGAGGASLEGFVNFLKSPEFKAMSRKPAFKQMAGNHEAFSQLLDNKVFASLVNQSSTHGSQELLSIIAGTLTNRSEALNNLFNNQQFANTLGLCSNFGELKASPEMQSLVNSNQELANLFSNQQFLNAMDNSAFFSFMKQNAKNMADLSNMIQNAAFGFIYSNVRDSSELFSNPAFGNLINQNMFGALSQVQALHGNQAFANLVNDNAFLSLLNNPDFKSLSTNADFQQFVKDAASQGSQFQPNAALVNQAQYHGLSNQPAFQNLLNNASFASVIQNASFGILVSQNNFGSLVFNQSFISNAQSSQSLHNLVNQSQVLNTVF
jgi:hypothetical protein